MRVFQRPTLMFAELICVLLAAPFLLFPHVKPALTLAVLSLLGLVWLVQLLCGWWVTPVTPLNGPLLVWSLTIAVGTAVTAYPELTLPKATGLLLGLAVWRILTVMPDKRQGIRLATVGLFLMSLASLGLGLLTVNWTAKLPLIQPLIDYLPNALFSLPEMPAEGVNANQMGGVVATLLPLAFAAFLDSLRRRRTGQAALVLAGMLAMGTVLLLLQSRSAWVGAAAGVGAVLALLGLTGGRRQRRATLSLGLLASVLAPIAGLIFATQERMGALFQETQGLEAGVAGTLSLAARSEIWTRALYAIQDFVFTGCGLGTFREVVWVLYPLFTIPYGRDIAHAHNMLLQVALDTGVPGLIAYLALLGTAIATSVLIAVRQRPYKLLALGLSGGLVALHVYGLTDALAPGSKPAIIFWYMLGLLAALSQTSGEKKAAPAEAL